MVFAFFFCGFRGSQTSISSTCSPDFLPSGGFVGFDVVISLFLLCLAAGGLEFRLPISLLGLVFFSGSVELVLVGAILKLMS